MLDIDPESVRYAAQASALATELALLMGGGALGGWWLDGRLATTPVLTLVGLGVGGALGVWVVLKTLARWSATPPDRP